MEPTTTRGIRVLQVWGVIWIGWCLALLLAWVPIEPILSYRQELLTWIAVVFFPLELIGAYDLRNDDPATEVAKTLSQLMQAIAAMGKPGSPWMVGWKSLPVGVALLLGETAYTVLHRGGAGNQRVAIIAAVVVVALNAFHWVNRRRFG
jgi:hypothetical protein